MTARLTATLLAFCIALPMCWCCAAEAEAAPEMACCAMMQQEPCGDTSPQDGKVPHCPCLSHEDSRDTADAAVAMPVPELKPLSLIAWRATDLPLASKNLPARNLARHDHGPPGVKPPIYQRHCALLI